MLTDRQLQTLRICDGLSEDAADEIERLRAECEALRKDAERYRWLRELPNADSLNVRFMGADLDRIIDGSQ